MEIYLKLTTFSNSGLIGDLPLAFQSTNGGCRPRIVSRYIQKFLLSSNYMIRMEKIDTNGEMLEKWLLPYFGNCKTSEWNKLPPIIINSPSLPTFVNRLKHNSLFIFNFKYKKVLFRVCEVQLDYISICDLLAARLQFMNNLNYDVEST